MTLLLNFSLHLENTFFLQAQQISGGFQNELYFVRLTTNICSYFSVTSKSIRKINLGDLYTSFY